MGTKGKYAAATDVSPERSKLEIEQILSKYGASSFASGWQGNTAAIIFEAHGRRVKFVLPFPTLEDREVTHRKHDGWQGPTADQKNQRLAQEVRRRWRCLVLAIKAKLEVVESGIATFEEEFLAHIVLPNGEPVGSWMGPQIQKAYETAQMPSLLMLGSGGK